jgi:hypothetical protein
MFQACRRVTEVVQRFGNSLGNSRRRVDLFLISYGHPWGHGMIHSISVVVRVSVVGLMDAGVAVSISAALRQPAPSVDTFAPRLNLVRGVALLVAQRSGLPGGDVFPIGSAR